mmetsp:Transcript_17900/g.29935  ORF Transcript_17900/g.29935 Transcript_17900/m.29935 type:complete len:280 (-) Transcript_17900:659-1498(-)
MSRWLLFTTLMCLCHGNSENNHWIILHYHKTGNFLSNTLTKPFAKKNISVFADNLHKRVQFDPSRFLTRPGDSEVGSNSIDPYPIIISRAGNFFFDWNTVLRPSTSNRHGHKSNKRITFRVAHMVRDPYDMALSGLLYHSLPQMPEGWLGHRINPCLQNAQDMKQFLSIISQHPCGPSVKTLEDYIRQITITCRGLHNNHTTGNYHRTLRTMMAKGLVLEALQMETSRTILSGDICGADLLRMAANAVHENRAIVKVLPSHYSNALQLSSPIPSHHFTF